jgi:S-adenosylmethionine decarboxylase proenzyme
MWMQETTKVVAAQGWRCRRMAFGVIRCVTFAVKPAKGAPIDEGSPMEALGRHLILEYHGCCPSELDDIEFLEDTIVEATEATRATIVHSHFHRYAPQGVSGAVVISESHVTTHTWPEFGYMAADIFTCGVAVDPWVFHHRVLAAIKVERSSSMELRRGLLDVPKSKIPLTYEGSDSHRED